MNWNWLAIESTATVGLAGFTALMAGMTWRVIADGRKHHKDQYRPILALVPADGVDPACRTTCLKPERSPSDGRAEYSLGGLILKNIGLGPALDCRMTIRFQDIEGYGVTPSLAPVQAGGEYQSGLCPLRIPVSFERGFSDTDFQMAPAAGWQLFLEYKDLFGQAFHTVHRSDPRGPWTTLGQGPIPKGEGAEGRVRGSTQSVSVSCPEIADPR